MYNIATFALFFSKYNYSNYLNKHKNLKCFEMSCK